MRLILNQCQHPQLLRDRPALVVGLPHIDASAATTPQDQKFDLAENGMTDGDVRELIQKLEGSESQDLQYDLWMFEADS